MDRVDTKHVDRLNDLYRVIAQQRAGQVFIVDLNGFMSETVGHGDVVNGMDLRSDDIHFTLEGADMIVRWLAPQILVVIPEERRSSTGASQPSSQ
jgi:lysophospholipase L1-like esterase